MAKKRHTSSDIVFDEKRIKYELALRGISRSMLNKLEVLDVTLETLDLHGIETLHYKKQIWKSAILRVKNPIRVYKKTFFQDDSIQFYSSPKTAIVRLLLPEDTFLVVHNYSSKIRASAAFVESIVNLKSDNTSSNKKGHGYSSFHNLFKYRKEEMVFPSNFSFQSDICTDGIHCFFNRDSALNYAI